MYNQPFLEHYKGKATRHLCPNCGSKNSFTHYLDGNTQKPINSKVGRCERESKCGYHYTPKQFYMDNPQFEIELNNSIVSFMPTSIASPRPIDAILYDFVEKSTSHKSKFVQFLSKIITTDEIQEIYKHYALGATRKEEVIFWQIDTCGKVRTGKIMQYDPDTGKRIKNENIGVGWVHNKLKNEGQLPTDFNLTQCFFGEHLLKLYPTAIIGIVESEKTALIASVMMPNFIWLAAGNLNGLSIDKCKVLQGREVVLFPDLGGFEKWNKKATELLLELGIKISVSDLLELEATLEERENGLDIADYIIEQMLAQKDSRKKSA